MVKGLEKKAEKNILESIEKLVASSFLMLLLESLILKSNPALKDAFKEKSIKGIYDYLVETVINIKALIDDGGDEKEFHLRKCLQMKEKILEVYNVLKIYISGCNIIDLCVEEKMQLSEESETNPIPLAELKKLFKRKVTQVLDEAVKHDIEEAASAILFTVLPNHFSDSELIDYITFSGKFYLENSPHPEGVNHSRQIMRSFAPQKMQEYGKYYPKEAEKLFAVIEAMRISGLEDDYKKTIAKYDKICVKIEGIADALSSMYTALTYVSILLSSMFTTEDIFKSNKVIQNYFDKTAELLGGAGDENAMDEMLSRLDNVIEKEVEQLNDIAKRKELIYKNVNFENFSENTKTLFSMEFFLTTAFFENIEDAEESAYEFSEEMEDAPADIKTSRKELKSLTLFVKESCFGMNDTFKRNARRNLFLSVPLASYYNKSKVMKYVDRLCDEVSTVAELESALNSIEKIIDDEVLLKLSVLEY